MDMEGQPRLERELGFVELLIIGIAGAVGTGVFFSSAGMAAIAGPSSIISWLLGGFFYLFIGLTYAELSRAYPEAGGPARYSLYTHGRSTNLINSFADLLWYLFIPPIEALAVIAGLEYFIPGLFNLKANTPSLIGSFLGMAILLIFIPFNYFGIKSFGRLTRVFGAFKIAIYMIVALGLISIYFSKENFRLFGGFVPFGAAGIFSAIPLAMFSFGGIRVIPDYAEEVKDPSSMPRAIILTVLGQTFIYIIFSIAFIGGINWTALNFEPGSWKSLGSIVGNPFVLLSGGVDSEWLLLITIAVAIIGPFVTGYIYLGSGTRVLFAMGRSRLLSSAMKNIHEKYSIPAWALISFSIAGSILVFISAPVPTIYNLLVYAVVAGYIGLSANPVVMMVSRLQGATGDKVPFGNAIAPMGFVSASLIVFWSGWPSVPYSIGILSLAVIIFGVIFKVKENLNNSIWYISYIAWILLMTSIGSVGFINLIPFWLSSVIVAAISAGVFFPWGIKSGLKRPYYNPQLNMEIKESFIKN